MAKFLKKKLKVFTNNSKDHNINFNKKKNIHYCSLHISGTTNNIFLTLVKKGGDVIANLSSGRFKGMKGKKKKCGTFVAQKMGYILGLKAFYLDYVKINIVIKNTLMARLIYSITTGLSHSGAQVVSLINYYPYARNGVKLRKVRRK